MKNNFFKLKYNEYFFSKKKINKINIFKNNEYWKNYEKFVDPDGLERNLLLEKTKKIHDLKNEIEFIRKKFKNKRKKSIIDLGSGFGFFLSAFNKSWRKVGIEISKLASQNSKKWSEIFHLDLQKKFEKKELNKLKKFDVVFSYHVIEHLKKPEILLENAYNILKKDGIFILGTPNFDSGCARKFTKKYRFFNDKTHITFFSENSLFRMLTDYGFKVDYVDYPYFETSHFSIKNLKRLFNHQKISPPFYGNIMTFYCKKMNLKEFKMMIEYKKDRLSKLKKNFI